MRIPLPKAFWPLLERFKYRYKVFYGGRAGAKSWSFARALVWLTAQEKLRVLCTRELQNSITDSVHKLLCDQIEQMGMSHLFEITQTTIRCTRTGSEFIFKGLRHNAQEIKSTEGIDICWVEEAVGISEENWNLLTKTVRKNGSEIWVSFNPIDADDPTYKRFVLRNLNGCYVRRINYDENPFFTEASEIERQLDLDKIRDAKNDGERLQAQADYDYTWLGECRRMAMAGILKRWDVREFETPEKARFFHGADWGFANDPTALVRSYVEDECLYVDQEAFGYHVEIDDTAALFDRLDTARKWPIKADSSRPETISYLRRQGFTIEAAEKWPGSVEDGIAHLNGFKRIIIHPRCTHVAHEARHYQYKVDRLTRDILPVIVDAHNHGIDAIRYSLDGYILHRGGSGVWAKLAN